MSKQRHCVPLVLRLVVEGREAVFGPGSNTGHGLGEPNTGDELEPNTGDEPNTGHNTGGEPNTGDEPDAGRRPYTADDYRRDRAYRQRTGRGLDYGKDKT